MSGVHPYADPAYVAALVPKGGRVETVAAWRNAVIIRPIAQGGFDAMGSYPLTPFSFACDIGAGLETLKMQGLISATLVPDPLASPSVAELTTHFDLVRPFKTHLTIGRDYTPSKHHRERIRRGLRRCRVERGPLKPWLKDWTDLYAGLVVHRAIGGMANFRTDYFRHLAESPGLQAFAAFCEGRISGMTLWFSHQGVVYNHLTACNAMGYANGAAFALYDAAICHFAGEGIINLGGGAGSSDSDAGGLFAFKQGFANGKVTAHICGQILDKAAYARLSDGVTTDFFPAYRSQFTTP